MVIEGTFHSNRTLPFPPRAVYSAFANPALLAQWWGPDGFTNEFDRFDFNVNGTWQLTMIGPNGTHYFNLQRFLVLEPDQQIVLRHEVEPLFTLTITLLEVPTGTELDWLQAFDDPGFAASVRHIIEPANEQNLNRLTAVLSGKTG